MPSPAARQHLSILATFVAITIVQTWPLVTQVSSVLPNDLGDPILNTWMLWWNAHAVPLTRAWWDAPIFFPSHDAMAFSETALGSSLFASPLQWMGASPVTAYNVLFLLSFPLSAFAAHLLAWTLTRRTGPSIVAGAIYGYALFRWAHLGHLQILWSWWMPLALLGLHRWLTEARKSGLLLFAACWLGESLSNGYYFFYFSLIVALWLAWFMLRRDMWRQRLVPAVLTWIAAIALMSPILLTYARVQQTYHFTRAFREIVEHSADLTDFFGTRAAVAMPSPAFDPPPAAAPAAQAPAAQAPVAPAPPAAAPTLPVSVRSGERDVELGLAGSMAFFACVAAVIAMMVVPTARAWPERRALTFYTVAALVAMVLAMGPRPRVFGVDVWPGGAAAAAAGLPAGPYAWLMAVVPGFTGVRVPARFGLIAVLCLSIATALLLARVRLADARRERLLFAGVVLAVLIEAWPRPISLPAVPPVLDARLLTANASAVIELPFGGDHEFNAIYRAIFHRRPLVNGYSGYFPAPYVALRECLAREAARQEAREVKGEVVREVAGDVTREVARDVPREASAPDCLAGVRRAATGPVDVVIDRQHDRGGVWRELALRWPGARLHFENHQFSVIELARP